MRFSRRAALVALALLAATAAPAAALTSPAADPAPMSPGFDRQLDALDAASTTGGFVHFADDRSPAQRVEAVRALGLTVTTRFDTVDALFAAGTAEQFRTLQRAPGISYLQEDAELAFDDETDGYATGAEVVRGPIGGGPFRDGTGQVLDGTGIGVAVIDSGVDGTHPDLVDRMAKNFKVVCQTPFIVWSSGPYEGQCFAISFNEVDDSDSSGGHGTHVAGIVAGTGAASEGLYTGVAPGAKLYGFGTGEGLSINTMQAASSFQWVLDNGDNVTPRVRIITNSYGCSGGCAYNPNDIINKLASKAANKGITVLFSAGNSGTNADKGDRDDTGGYQKNPTPGVIGVANYNDAGSGHRDNTLDSSSSRGLMGSPTTYPDLSAPGSSITATCKRGTAACETGTGAAWAPYYSVLSGTSMATPHTAGAVALLLQASPGLTPPQIEALLQDNANAFSGGTGAPGVYEADPQNPGSLTSYDKGHGLIDIPATLAALGRSGDGNHALAPVALNVSAPQKGHGGGMLELDGLVDVAGTADTTPRPRALISGDGGDYDGAGAADLVGLTITEEAGALVYTIAVRDADDVGGSGSVLLRINTNANGQRAWTGINVTPTSVAPATFSATTNNVIPSSVTRDLVANTITAVVPYGAFPLGAGESLGHNTAISSLTGVIQDVAPGGLGAELLTNPRQSAEWGFNAMPPGGGTVARVAIDGGTEAPLSVSGSGTSSSFAGQVDLSGYAPGKHKMEVRLYVDGYRRAAQEIPFEIPARAAAAPVVTTPAEGAITPKTVTFSGTAESGSTVRVAKGTTTLATTKVKSDGTWSVAKSLTGGAHTVSVTATNAIGSVTPATVRSFTVDAVGPKVAFTTANDTTFLPEQAATVTGTAGDANGIDRIVVRYTDATGAVVATVTATCDACGTAATAVSWSSTVALNPGTYRVVATAYDRPGNVASTSIGITRL